MHMKKMLPVLACALISSPALALDIVFTYDDNSGFFTNERRDALERAASVYESYITNGLNVFVSLDSTTDTGALAWGGTSIIADFETDWTGKITFNEGSDWYSGADESFSGIDLFSVALHELGHVLGVGIVDTWTNKVSGDYFYGANAVGLYGSPVPVDATGEHWITGTESTLPGTLTWQIASYDPFFTDGQRLYLTDLDLAGLQDIGWSVSTIPEPGTLYLLLSGLAIVGLRARRHRRTA
ncbi:MAG: matrixin family metalloprotease [Betaproteobacteria bacterium]|nr:matrixin family metalloprotease [Betaproteobacteria bacterium]